MNRATLALPVAFLLVASPADAEKLKGFLWEVSPTAIVVEGQTIRMTADTDVDRSNHKDITAKDLRIGWEVEVDTTGAAGALVAKRVLVKNGRFQEEKIEGVVEGVASTHFNVDGDEIRVPSGTVPAELKAGMRFKGKGVRLMENRLEWHYLPLTESQYQDAVIGLDEPESLVDSYP